MDDVDLYYVRAAVGTPESNFTLIWDTGSSTTALPCANCTSCGHETFDPDVSATAKWLGEEYAQCYGEGSCLLGEWTLDRVRLLDDGPSFPQHAFGCCDVYAPMFKTQFESGIMGVRGKVAHALEAFSLCSDRVQVGYPSNFKDHVWTSRNEDFEIRVWVEGELTTALLDSGSNRVYVPRNLTDKLFPNGTCTGFPKLRTMEGDTLNANVSCDMVMVNDFDDVLILGSPFLRAFGKVTFLHRQVGFAMSTSCMPGDRPAPESGLEHVMVVALMLTYSYIALVWLITLKFAS